ALSATDLTVQNAWRTEYNLLNENPGGSFEGNARPSCDMRVNARVLPGHARASAASRPPGVRGGRSIRRSGNQARDRGQAERGIGRIPCRASVLSRKRPSALPSWIGLASAG